MYYIVALGNPGEEYELSRHNMGRLVVDVFLEKQGIDREDYKDDKGLKALVWKGETKGGGKFQVIYPETFMNNSGKSVKPLADKMIKEKKVKDSTKKEKNCESLVVVHDDLDIGLGSYKICYGRGSAGHKGVDSIIKAVKTKNFVRIRVGVRPTTPSGKLKKISDAKKLDFIIGNLKPKELDTVEKMNKTLADALEVMVDEGKNKAMSLFN